jgi:hypothetical protein
MSAFGIEAARAGLLPFVIFLGDLAVEPAIFSPCRELGPDDALGIAGPDLFGQAVRPSRDRVIDLLAADGQRASPISLTVSA